MGIKIEIGGGSLPHGDGFLNIDMLPIADVQFDLESLANGAILPFEDNSVSDVYSSHCLEHLTSIGETLIEICRVCEIGARVEIRLPHWLHDSAMAGGMSSKYPGHYHSYGDCFFWWIVEEPGCEKYWTGTKRLKRVATYYQPERCLDEVRPFFAPLGMSDDQIMRFIPGTSHEVRNHFIVVAKEPPQSASPA